MPKKEEKKSSEASSTKTKKTTRKKLVEESEKKGKKKETTTKKKSTKKEVEKKAATKKKTTKDTTKKENIKTVKKKAPAKKKSTKEETKVEKKETSKKKHATNSKKTTAKKKTTEKNATNKKEGKKKTPIQKKDVKSAKTDSKKGMKKKADKVESIAVEKQEVSILSKLKNRISVFAANCKKTYHSLNTRRNNLILRRFIIISLFLLLALQFTNSIYHIVTWQKENKAIEEQVEEIEKEIVVEEKEEDPEKTEVIKPVEEPKKEDPYWDYIKMKLINVDFKELKKKNNHTVGWIQVNGTNINYPFVQTNNNDFYLNHAYDKSYNSAGWVFMDYRNSLSDFDKNTILYAHGRLDNTMFGSLRYILKNEWIKNSENYVIKLSTEYENTLWQVFSIYRIPTTSDYLQIEFKDGKAFTKFTNKLIKRSQYNFKTKIGENDKIITLSTCFDDNDKLVLHAKLIKREAR